MFGLCKTENGTQIDELLEDGRVPVKDEKIGKLRDKKITRKEYQRLLNKFEMEAFMAQKGVWNLARNKALQDRGALPQEEGNTIREF